MKLQFTDVKGAYFREIAPMEHSNFRAEYGLQGERQAGKLHKIDFEENLGF